MKSILKVFLAALILAAPLFLAVNPALSKNSKRFAADFTLPDLADKPVTLSSYKNKQPVLLIFWTTWCPYCRKELKLTDEKYKELTKEGLVVLAVNIGEPVSRINSFIKINKLTCPVVMDKDGSVSSSYGVLGIPSYILIDKKGYIRFQEHHFPEKEYKALTLE